jgi:MFS family permease
VTLPLSPARIPAIARNPRFLAPWAAQSVSTLGDALTAFTLILLITQRTHSVAAVGALTVVLAVPGILIGPVSGAYVDRWNRRRVMIGGDACRAVLLAVLALGSSSLAALYLIAFLQAIVGTFAEPAGVALLQTSIPADEQVRANSLIQTTTVLAELAGTTLAGVFVATLHVYWVSFAVDAATFALSAASIAKSRPWASPNTTSPRLGGRSATGCGPFAPLPRCGRCCWCSAPSCSRSVRWPCSSPRTSWTPCTSPPPGSA